MTSSSTLFFILLCIPSLVAATSHQQHRRTPSPSPLWGRSTSKNIPPEGYYNPLDGGGSFLTGVQNVYPPDLGEPVNMILTANSDAAALIDQEAKGGLRNYFLSFGFAGECLGQHSGSDQTANLGDGNGPRNETAVMRWDYGNPTVGTCQETVSGGNHFRYWVQNGKDQDTGAIFMACSYEMPIAQQHNIIPNGYNYGRDWIVGNITGQIVPSFNLTNSSSYSGNTTSEGYTYSTTINYVSGLLQNTSIGINHNDTVQVDGFHAIDGLVAVMTVKIVGRPPGSDAWRPVPLQTTGLILILSVLALTLP